MNHTYHDAIKCLAGAGAACGVQLVRITAPDAGNRYTARPVEFTAAGATQPASTETLSVVNLAEPADQPGQLAADNEAVALDVEGRWVIFVRVAAATASPGVFAAKVVAALGSAAYTIREQTLDTNGAFIDKSGTLNVSAKNLAELSLGSGAAVAVGTIVLATTITDGGTPPSVAYIFDHPAYAKYLE